MDKYLKCARGRYQRGILTGRYRLSGADLRGKARDWSARYARSRSNLLNRLSKAGLPYHVEIGAHNRQYLVLDNM